VPTPDKQKEQIAALQLRVTELEQLLVTDEQLLIYNRQGLMQYLNLIAEEVRWQHKHPDKRRNVVVRSLSVLFVDIDKFKYVNDTYGHDSGDIVLRRVASLIKEETRDLDVVGRYGGEEIVVGLVGASSEHALKKADAIRQRIADEVFDLPGNEKIQVTVSVGVAELLADTLDQAIKRADEALFTSKSAGRNRVTLAPPYEGAL
jgi:diguanylate cyclase (GGDEF)-like protein